MLIANSLAGGKHDRVAAVAESSPRGDFVIGSDGSVLRSVGQKVVNTLDGTFSIELLSRLTGTAQGRWGSISEFVSRMSLDDRFDMLMWQTRLADRIHGQLGIGCSINIDNQILQSERHRNRLMRSVEDSVAPIVYEFTEVYPMPPADLMNPLFSFFRENGKKSALDDFGTGFNGMSLFVDYDFDIIKVDRSLILDIEVRPAKLKVLTLLAEMLDTLAKRHVVEGVETQQQLQMLTTAGFNVFQGYLLHRPEPIADLATAVDFGALGAGR